VSSPTNEGVFAGPGSIGDRSFVPFWFAIPAKSTKVVGSMSQHPSLKGKGSISAKRSVLKRFERVELLKKRGQFKEGQRVIGLPKTRPEE
jgi:small basic protein (TIGR04137 family)